MTFEAHPGSPLPDQLRDNGYEISETGTTQRNLSASAHMFATKHPRRDLPIQEDELS
jgi:hypothetical protein